MVPEFGNDMSVHCPLTYESFLFDGTDWLVIVDERTVQWQTDDNTKAGEYKILQKALDIDGNLESFIFYYLIVEKDCTSQTLTPPSVTNQTYTVNGIAGSFTVPEFVNSEPACDVLYSMNYNNLLGWLSSPSERSFAWQTGDNFDAGEYQITIYASTENSATTE